MSLRSLEFRVLLRSNMLPREDRIELRLHTVADMNPASPKYVLCHHNSQGFGVQGHAEFLSSIV